MSNDQVILHHYPPITGQRKGPRGAGPEGAGLEVRGNPAPAAKAEPDAVDRGLSANTGDADRRRCLLRHQMHYSGAGAALPRTPAVSRRRTRPALGQWTDGPLFQDVVCVALVEMSPNMPAEFLADRGPLYFGLGFSLDDIKAKYLECLSNVRAQFGWIDERLASI